MHAASMNTVTTLVAAATSDQAMLDTIDRVAGKGATWWLAAIGVLLLCGLGFLLKWMVDQNRSLFSELKEANEANAKDLRDVVVSNTVAMTRVASAIEEHSRRVDALERKA